MRRFQHVVRGALIAVLLASCSSTAYAEEEAQPKEGQLCPICAVANDDAATYQEKAGNTFLRGLLNTGLGWTEMIRQPAKEAKDGGNLFVGVANGIGQSVTRTLTGLGELATFWTPKIQNRYIHFAQDCPLDTTK